MPNDKIILDVAGKQIVKGQYVWLKQNRDTDFSYHIAGEVVKVLNKSEIDVNVLLDKDVDPNFKSPTILSKFASNLLIMTPEEEFLFKLEGK